MCTKNIIEEGKSRCSLAIFCHQDLPILIQGVDMFSTMPSIRMDVKKLGRHITLFEPK
jgi:hypothetical protein